MKNMKKNNKNNPLYVSKNNLGQENQAISFMITD